MPGLKCQVEDEEEGGDDESGIVPESVTFEQPIVESVARRRNV